MRRGWRRVLDRYAIPVLLDGLSVVVAYYLAIALRFAGRPPLTYTLQFQRNIWIVVALHCLFNALLGLYERLWRYAGAEDLMPIVESVAASTLVVATAALLWSGSAPLLPNVIPAAGLFTLVAFAAIRYRSQLLGGFLRRWRSRAEDASATRGTRVLLVGAGQAGQLLAWRLLNAREGAPYYIVGFVDDDQGKHDLRIHGIKVLGDRHQIPEIVRAEGVELIVIAIHTISREDFEAILSICQSTSAKIKVLPDVFENLRSLRQAALLRDLTVEDLVGRTAVSINRQDCRDLLCQKVVLVTGAGGTIGAELCRQIVHFEPRLLVMLDNNETGLHDLNLGLRLQLQAQDVAPVLSGLSYVVADVTDRQRMEWVFREYRPEIALHAAAYKHVPLMEHFPEAAVRVNVGGTWSLFEMAARHGTERLVLISTDKAADPVSVLGASKRIGEMMAIAAPASGPLITAAVRFGNVLGSRGSVVPTFERQIDAGGPITVTHPEATRFFMSVGEAVSLVLQAATMAQGGEVFMLDMGEQIRIIDLATRMIRLHGLRVGKDIRIVHTGLRTGERLHEKLVANSEQRLPTAHPKIFAVRSRLEMDWTTLTSEVEELQRMLDQGASRARLVQNLFAVAGAPEVAEGES